MTWGALFWIATIACQTLDGVTTWQALNRGYTDVNPLMRTRPAILSTKAGITIGARFVWGKGRTPARHIIPVALATNGCAGGIHNLRELR
jgi:hypothetical protein